MTVSDNEPQSIDRGLADDSAEPRFLVVGRVLKPHGIRGEVRIEVHTDDPDRFGVMDQIYLGDRATSLGVESYRYHKSWILLKLAGIDSRSQAYDLQGQWLHVPIDQAIPLGPGEYFLYQALGIDVEEEGGRALGKIVDIIETGANNVFVVEGESGEILLPDIDDVILEVDLEDRIMIVRLLPGLV